MKAQILKIAGVKNESEFYRKFPTEEAFMKKHGKELQKAALGLNMKKAPVNVQSTMGAMDQSVANNSYVSKEDSYAAAQQAKDKQMNNLLKESLTALPGIVGGFQTMYEEQEQLRKADALAKIADLEKDIRPVQQYPQKIVRPEDSRTVAGQMYKPLGDPNVNYLSRNGSEIGGNPTEIQNMYNPGDMYDDLGFEPLGDSNIKRFEGGGTIDYSKFAPSISALSGSLGSAFGGGKFQTNTAASTGGSIGGLIGTVGTMVTGVPALDIAGNALGSWIGGEIGGESIAEAEKKRNKGMGLVGNAATQNLLQDKYSANARNGMSLQEGGYMNPEYNPQVIAKFGDYDVDQLFAPPHDADMLRAGGHLKEYTPPSASAMYTGRDQMQYGGQMQGSTSDGELHALWGGGFEPLSYNPVTGTTIDLAVGNSHDTKDPRTGETGIGVGYEQGGTIDDAQAEIETNEPVMTMKNGGKSSDKIVVGAMVNPLTGRQFKKDVKDIAMKEQKQNKLLEKSADLANNTKTYTTIDKIRLNTAKAMELGAKMKLGQLGQQNQEYATLQNAIKDTAQEFGYKAADLAKGKITPLTESDIYGRDGLTLAKDGLNMRSLFDLAKLYQTAVKTKDAMAIGKFQKAALEAFGADEVKKITGAKNVTKKSLVDGIFGPSTNALGKAVTQKINQTVTPTTAPDPNAVYQIPPEEALQEYAPNVPEWMPAESRVFTPGVSEAEEAARKARKSAGVTKDDSLYGTAAATLNSLIPFVQGADQYKLDPNQLLGERYALLNNQQEPVFAQSYTPELISPYSIGADDQINQVTSEANAAYRLMQNNPELAANAAAQAYNAKNQIRSKVSQANQEQRFNTIKSNTDALNQAKLANIQLYGDQSDKMAGAKANTVKQTEAALQSIGAKIAQAKNEQMQFNIARATFPAFNYTPSGQVYKNPYYNAFFNKNGEGPGKSKGVNGTMEDENGNTLLPVYDAYGKIKSYTVKKTKSSSNDDTEDLPSRNGGNLARAIKNL
jgi:hypothetical protein